MYIIYVIVQTWLSMLIQLPNLSSQPISNKVRKSHDINPRAKMWRTIWSPSINKDYCIVLCIIKFVIELIERIFRDSSLASGFNKTVLVTKSYHITSLFFDSLYTIKTNGNFFLKKTKVFTVSSL